ncbi:MAG: hypothetical protein DHS20C19_22410 [Acidimicrobiales bacterium]|nr:MAG: hypothetical protein DHS20C19_22410 [Acidimicrobiales bacterium]
MGDSYSRRGFVMKGAIIELKDGGLIGVSPSITIFQYNPESLSRSIIPKGLQALRERGDGQNGSAEPEDDGAFDFSLSAQPHDPREEISLSLVIDAVDDMDEGNKLGVATGIADRLASLELLTYANATAIEQALDAVGGAIAGALGFRAPEEAPMVPVQLFWFGPGKLVPVRITSMTIEEQAFHSVSLYPIRAKVSLGLRVLRPHELDAYPASSLAATIAKGCYIFTREQKSLLATVGGPIRLIDSALTAINPDLGDIL